MGTASSNRHVRAIGDEQDLIDRDIIAFLNQHEKKEILRFLTCGSVDDGKSTLIGRLLHDTNMVYLDHLEALKRDTKRGGGTNGELDLSLLVDGLQAEREQGITIDVAYRYFSTDQRKFIIADTPGHEQYTRNMATGASNCELAVILIDAKNGITPQTQRHTYVARLLGIKRVLIAINKMDLVDYAEQRYHEIVSDFSPFLRKLPPTEAVCIPLSAKLGDNVVERSEHMSWYTGPTLLELLHSVPVGDNPRVENFHMVVQRVNRTGDNFRGYSGTIASGVVKPGDVVAIQPKGIETKVDRIVTMDGDLAEAHAPMSITLTLQDELDISRGDSIVQQGVPVARNATIEATIVWMGDRKLETHKKYMIKHGADQIAAEITEIKHRIDITNLSHLASDQLHKNEIGSCAIDLDRSIVYDDYLRNRTLGSFIVIDRLSNATVGAGLIGNPESFVSQESLTSSHINPPMSSWIQQLPENGLNVIGPQTPAFA